ncbi:MAG: SDR family oxidoreductase [Actinomycetota bacterium]|nr:SDR family oxidoreductase [Actinomycetota bacterium]
MDSEPVMLITGASSGIGAQTARRAAEAGYRLVLGARREDELVKLASELGGQQRAIAVPADVTSWEDQERLAEAATRSFGRLDVVFANAGFGAERGFLKETPEHWRSMVLTNVYGAALTIRANLPTLLEAGSGHFLITGSVAGRRALPGSLYSSTKWAVTGMAESLRQELREMHQNTTIRVTLIEPGMTDTDFFTNRPGTARALADDDIARAVLYAMDQPDGVDINEILIRPSSQPT